MQKGGEERKGCEWSMGNGSMGGVGEESSESHKGKGKVREERGLW